MKFESSVDDDESSEISFSDMKAFISLIRDSASPTIGPNASVIELRASSWVIGATSAALVAVCGEAKAEELIMLGMRQATARVRRPALSRLKKLFIVILVYVDSIRRAFGPF